MSNYPANDVFQPDLLTSKEEFAGVVAGVVLNLSKHQAFFLRVCWWKTLEDEIKGIKIK